MNFWSRLSDVNQIIPKENRNESLPKGSNKTSSKNYSPSMEGKLLSQSSCSSTLSNQAKSKIRAPNADIRDGTNGHPLTELGNAGRLYDLHHKKLKYCPEMKAWLHWEINRWEWDNDGSRTRELSSQLPEIIYGEGVKTLENDYYLKWARKSSERRTIENAVTLLSDRIDIRIDLASIDSDPFVIGINEGRQLVDLRNGNVRNTQPCDFITKKLMVNRVGDAAGAIKWIRFLNQIFLGDQELIEWIQRLLGYSLTGSTQEQMFSFGFGSGSNGKGVLMSLLRQIWGDYYRTVAVETLMNQKRVGSAPSPDLADLVGARLIMSGETESGAALSESLIKLLTGEDKIKCRRLHKDPFEFIPQFKIFMAGNHKPTVKGIDNGIWRRIRLIPFDKIFTANEQDKTLVTKLLEEREHILAWLINGCLAWHNQGLQDIPRRIRSATEQYREDQDIVGQWLGERCALTPDGKSMARDLYNDYLIWVSKAGDHNQLSEVKFANNLMARPGIARKLISAGRIYLGIALHPMS